MAAEVSAARRACGGALAELAACGAGAGGGRVQNRLAPGVGGDGHRRGRGRGRGRSARRVRQLHPVIPAAGGADRGCGGIAGRGRGRVGVVKSLRRQLRIHENENTPPRYRSLKNRMRARYRAVVAAAAAQKAIRRGAMGGGRGREGSRRRLAPCHVRDALRHQGPRQVRVAGQVDPVPQGRLAAGL